MPHVGHTVLSNRSKPHEKHPSGSAIVPFTCRGMGPQSSENVAIIDERTVLKSASQRGRPTFTEKLAVSPDGNVAIDDVSYTQPIATVTNSELCRVSAGPPGSHAISGSWRMENVEGSPNTIIVTFHRDASLHRIARCAYRCPSNIRRGSGMPRKACSRTGGPSRPAATPNTKPSSVEEIWASFRSERAAATKNGWKR
jgi:hypothetical protein